MTIRDDRVISNRKYIAKKRTDETETGPETRLDHDHDIKQFRTESEAEMLISYMKEKEFIHSVNFVHDHYCTTNFTQQTSQNLILSWVTFLEPGRNWHPDFTNGLSKIMRLFSKTVSSWSHVIDWKLKKGSTPIV